MELANRISNIQESRSIKLAEVLWHLRQQGKKIISLNVGEADFPTPQAIVEATKKALDADCTRYSLVEGIQELREAIAAKIKSDHNLKISADHVFVGNGSKHILYNIFQTLINPGDEVIIPLPYWVTFPESVKLAGGTPVFVHTTKNQLCIENIKKALSPKTKAILINSPNNPTGAIYHEESLRELAKLAKEKDFLIISDEAYEALVYDNSKHINIAAFDEETFQRTITVQSFSKSYCMTGFRLGYMVASPPIIKGVNKLQSHLSGNNCTFAQYGALAALENSQEIVKHMVQKMEERRNLAFELTSQIFEVEKPQGAFYLFPKVESYFSQKIPNDEALAEYILKETGVALLPGTYFGTPGFLRICFASRLEDITTGLNLIKQLLS